MFGKSKVIGLFLAAIIVTVSPQSYATQGNAEGQPKSGKDYSATWTGTCVNGHVSGRGILTVEDGRFEGEFRDGKLQGHGVMSGAPLFNGEEKLKDVKYEGEFKDTLMHGYGLLVIEEVLRYEGEFKRAMMHGQGVMIMKKKGIRYEGEFKNNNMHGRGVLEVKDKYRYEGDFKNNRRNGYGIQEFLDDSRYEGQYLDDWRHGHGTWTLRDEKKCKGEWNKGQLVGLAKGWVNGQAKACVTEDYAVKFLD